MIKLILPLFLFLSACTNKYEKALPDLGETLDPKEKLVLVEELKAAQKIPNAFKSLVRIKAENNEDKYLYRQAIVYQQPQSLRLETLPQQAAYSLQKLVIKDGKFSFNDYVEEKSEYGMYTEHTIKDFIGLPFNLEEFIALLLGQVPSVWNEKISKTSTMFKNNESLQLVFDNEQYYLELSEDKLVNLFQLRSKKKSKLLIEIQYDDYKTIADYLIPTNLIITIPRLELLMNLRAKVFDIDKKYPDSLFK